MIVYMKKILILLAAVSFAGCSLFQRTVFSENFDSLESFQKNWNTKKYKAPGNIIYAESAGIDETGCVKITSRRPTYLSAKSSIAGLEAGKLYRVSAMVRSKDIKNGSGAVIFVAKDGDQQKWNVSESFTGTNKEWQEIYVDFVADESGMAMICCGLGAPWDSGIKSTGTVWYDDLKVKRAPLGTSYNPGSERMLTPVEEEAPIEE